jgi:hypothetical protein
MGISGGVLRSLVIAVVVIVVHIGIKAFCADYGGKPGAKDEVKSAPRNRGSL